MRKRNVKKNYWLSTEEAEEYYKKVKKTGLNESEFFRAVILGYKIKEKPDERFYNVIKDLRGIAINLNQLAKKANTLNYIDVNEYKYLGKEVTNLISNLKREYLINNEENSNGNNNDMENR